MNTNTGLLKFLGCAALAIGIHVSLQADENKKADPVESGPKVGERAVPYHPLLANGNYPGQRWCMVCTNAGKGNAMVIAFVRDPKAKATTKLVETVEAAAKKHDRVGGIVTLLSTKGKTARQAEALTGRKVVYINDAEKKQFVSLQKLAKEKKLTKSNLNIYTDDGPVGYGLAKEAEATVLVVDHRATVKANIALRKSELTDERLKKIATEIDQALSKKE